MRVKVPSIRFPNLASPGYDVTPVEPLKSGLQCLECKLVLRDPVQTDEGDRLCRTCYDKIKRTGVSEGQGGIKLGEEETVSSIFRYKKSHHYVPSPLSKSAWLTKVTLLSAVLSRSCYRKRNKTSLD